MIISPNYVMVFDWKWTLASTESRNINLEPISVSFLSRRNIVLIWIEPPMYLWILFLLTTRYSLMVTCLHCTKYSYISCLTYFFELIFVSELNDGILWDFTKKSRLLYNDAYKAWMLPMNEASCFLFWINIWTISFSSSACCFVCFPKSHGSPLYYIGHSCTEVMASCTFLIVLKKYIHYCCKSCKQTTSLCMITRSS